MSKITSDLRPVPFPIIDQEFLKVQGKILQGTRLDTEDGLVLLKTPELPALGYLAEQLNIRVNGLKRFFVRNMHVNHTNCCALKCTVCAFSRNIDEPDGFLMPEEELEKKAYQAIELGVKEIHIVGGLHPSLPFSYYKKMIEIFREIVPDATCKAFTAVEIIHIANANNKSIEYTLKSLKDSGLKMLPGGGAEIFDTQIRQELFPNKPSAQEWLEVHKTAHELGLKTNATILFGHIEKPEHIVDHLVKLRELQDKTNGFNAFVPLVFHPENTEFSGLQRATGQEILRMLSVARLFLNNFQHIKAYWVMIGLKMASVAIGYGADDLDGTIEEEKITHDAGAKTPVKIDADTLKRLILEAGREPVERDSFYNEV